MRIVLNGEPRDVDDGTTIAALVEIEGLGNRRIAIEVNGAIVPKSLHAGTRLVDGDRVEIVHALGGG
jgi:sulfur carrier protein